jgi:hypothetical protein
MRRIKDIIKNIPVFMFSPNRIPLATQKSDGWEGGAASNPGSGSETAPGGEGEGISMLRIEGTRNGGENGRSNQIFLAKLLST